ncbi:MAG TPA: prolyl oligopeptidase family serine peptidase [Stellaceae bacterium]|nr:prolyl oligopeptidase family serine peptidase [Stellaceae bacterium]
MAQSLTGPNLLPRDGKPEQLIVLLHGFGADGNDLIGLAPQWRGLLPAAEFLSPDAPFPCEGAPFGRQWFGFQGRSREQVLDGVKTAAGILDQFLTEALAERGLDESQLALAGFSQGAMMSLYVSLRRAKPVAGVVAYSGRLFAADRLAAELRSKPPILLVHGDQDPVVPPEALPEAVAALEAAGVPVEAMLRPGLGHGIDGEGLARGITFLRQAFKIA